MKPSTTNHVKLRQTTVPLLVAVLLAAGQAAAGEASGPLRVHSTNGRYFMDGSGKAIYLTGAHTWQSLQDAY